MRSTWLSLLLAAAVLPATVTAAVRVFEGPTPIKDGAAKSAGDITLINEKLAVAIAVRSPVPYGVPRGAIVDVAPVVNGAVGRNCVVFADFIPNNWSAWPNTYQHIEILERGPKRAVVRAVRDWGKVTITTVYTLESNADLIAIRTTMSNGGPALPNLQSGMTLWPTRGYLFGVPGLAGLEQGPTAGALANRVFAYDESWSVALHAPYADRIGDGSKDLYRAHTLASGASRVFDAWLQVGASGDMKPVVSAEIARQHLASGTVRGTVRGSDGKIVETPVVVIEKQGKPFAWTVGRRGEYELPLPVGDYELYASAKNYSQSARAAVGITANAAEVRDFGDLRIPGSIEWTVADAQSGSPLDARISIEEGQKPLVEFLGRTTFFTELDRKGRVDLPIAPGPYVFAVSAGGGFLAERERIPVTVAPGQAAMAAVAVKPLFEPRAQGWYSADLHHHADQAEAVTPPADLARSQLAAGLDLLFVSDHDSTVNHAALQAIADRRGVPFIPSIELSTSWGHFNAYPVMLGQKLGIDTSTATIDDIVKESRRQGAAVLQVNHPFIPYGYFASLQAGSAPGGFNPAFDLMEINAAAPDDDAKVLHALWSFWNARHRYYLAAGTDTHDVWHYQSGAVRTFAHIDGTVTAAAFARALKAGHAYVSAGPLIFPTIMFGAELKVKPNEPFNLGFDLKSIAGIKEVQLIGSGAVLETKSFANPMQQTHVDFARSDTRYAWYSLIVTDRQDHKAYTDPIWVDPVDRDPVDRDPVDRTNRAE